MTFPTNPTGALDAGGAFVIGGGDFKFGQDYTDALVKQMFKVPAPTMGNALDLLREHLFKLPLEALQAFKELLPDVLEDAFDTVAGAVEAIMNALTDNPVFVTFAKMQEDFGELIFALSGIANGDFTALKDWFDEHVVGAIGGLDDTLQEIIDGAIGVLTGIPVIGGGVGQFIDALDDLWGDAQDALSGLDTLLDKLWNDPISVIGEIPQALVAGLEGALSGLSEKVQLIVDGVLERLTGLPVIGGAIGDLVDVLGDLWDKADEAKNGLTGLLINLLEDPMSVIGTIPRALVDGLDEALLGLSEKLQEIIDGVLGRLTGLPVFGGAIGDLIDILGDLWDKAGEAADGLSGLLTKLWEDPLSVIGQLPKVIISGLQDALDELGELAAGIIPALVKAITGVLSGDLSFLTRWFQSNVLTIFTGIPLSHIFDGQINLLPFGKFDTADTTSPTEGWVWDAGAAKAVCDGSTRQLIYRDVVPVSEGTLLNLSGKVKTSGITGTGWKVSLSLVEYHGDALGATAEIASRTTAAASWVAISGDYTVPEGVTSVAVRLAVTGATGGQAWFDELDLHKAGLLKQGWVDGLSALGAMASSTLANLNTLLTGLLAGPAAFIGNIADVVIDGISSMGQFLSQLWEGLTGGSGTGKTAANVKAATAVLASTAATASSTAGNAVTNGQTTLNELFDAFNGTTGSTGKTASEVRVRGAAVRATANSAQAGAAGAATAAANADTKAVAAQSAAATADGKATAADGKAVAADGKAVAAQSTADAAKTGGQTTLNELFDAFNGTTGSTGKTASEVRVRGAAVRTTANAAQAGAAGAATAAANADTKAVAAQSAAATADGKATAADGKAVAADGKAVAAQSKADAAFTNAGTADGKAVAAQTKASDTIDSIVKGWRGALGSGFTVADSLEVNNEILDRVSKLNTRVAALQSQQAAGSFSGVAKVEDLSKYPDSPSLGAAFNTVLSGGTGSATYGVASGYGQWIGTATTKAVTARHLTPTQTSFQRVSAVWSGDLGIGCSVYVYARANAAMTHYVYGKATRNSASSITYSIGYRAGGSEVALGSRTPTGYLSGLFIGSAMCLDAGTSAAAPRTFRLTDGEGGSSIVPDATDGSMLSTLNDTTNTFTGFGTVVANTATQIPPKLAAFSFYDNLPPTIRGSGFRQYRSAAAGVVGSSAGAQMLPASFFNTPDIITPDLAYDSTDNKLTVSVSGWYLVTARLGFNGGSRNTSNTLELRLLKNGIEHSKSDDSWGDGIGASPSGGLFGTFIVHCAKDDYLQVGYYSENSKSNLWASVGSSDTFMSVVFLGNSKAVEGV